MVRNKNKIEDRMAKSSGKNKDMMKSGSDKNRSGDDKIENENTVSEKENKKKRRTRKWKKKHGNKSTKEMRRQPMGKKMKRARALYAVLVLAVALGTVTVYANDPIAVVNNLSNFIFGMIRAIGMILLGFGIVQVGLSLKSHDPSQRANGFLTLAGGIIITFVKEILTIITG